MQSATRSVDKKNLQSIRKQNAKIQKKNNNCKQVPPVVLTSTMLKKKENLTKTTEASH